MAQFAIDDGAPAVPTVNRNSLAVRGRSDRFPIGRVFCIGRNYRWQAGASVEAEREPPVYFMKPSDAVVPAEGVIAYPPLTDDFCHEVELVVAIGQGGFEIAPAHASAHAWGYAVGLDLTRRDLQAHAKKAGQPWGGAKAFDASAPCGALVPAGQVDRIDRGAIWLDVNGAERQRADLAQLIWSVPELISEVSRSFTLRPGDLFFTGTPAGVGPLRVGDSLRAGIDGIGEIVLQIGAR